jgi:ABC-type polar amino acid transport system ATPase subunit
VCFFIREKVVFTVIIPDEKNYIISIDSIYKKFHNNHVLKGVSAHVAEGEVVCIVGPSGSGKSTLLRCLNLLERPTQGSIRILGEEITTKGFDIRAMRSKVGMVFQHFNLFPHMSVLENLMYAPLHVRGLKNSDAHALSMELLDRVGLADKASSKPHNLSGGQKQRVAIARCLTMEPMAVLFDEPTSALDPEMVKEVLEVIKSLVHTGMTILIVTHEMGFAKEVADTIWFLDEGQLIEKSSPDIFFTSPQSDRARIFLDKVLAVN